MSLNHLFVPTWWDVAAFILALGLLGVITGYVAGQCDRAYRRWAARREFERAVQIEKLHRTSEMMAADVRRLRELSALATAQDRHSRRLH